MEANLNDQLVFIEGTAAPSAIVAVIQNTGRDAILRGSGSSNSKAWGTSCREHLRSDRSNGLDTAGAAVCILETHSPKALDKVRGLVRMVQVSPSMTVVDLTVRGLSPGKYFATIRETGDISRGAISTGGVWDAISAETERKATPKGVFGTVEVSSSGIGTVFLDRPIQIWEMIGRGMVVSKQQDGKFQPDDPDTLVGVIARSAGVWDNEKTVCSCSGKTVWEERKDQVKKGML